MLRRLLALGLSWASAACTPTEAVAPPAPLGGPAVAEIPVDPPAPAVPAPPATTTRAALPRDFADFDARALPLRCARALRCGEIGASELDACMREGDARWQQLLGITRGLAAGRYRFDAAAAAACLDILADAPCHVDDEAIPSGCLGGAVPAGLAPNVPAGGQCERWEECIDGLCDGELGCPGRCKAFTAAVGGPCDQNTLCTPELFCDGDRCVARGDVGAECGGHWQACKPGLVCQGYVPETENRHHWRPEQKGECEARRGRDHKCRRVSLGDDCQPNFFCDFGAATPVCRERLGEGAACTWLDACSDGLGCDGLVLGEYASPNGSGMRELKREGVCRRIADRGATCDPKAISTLCPSSGGCSPEGTCRPRGLTDEPCRERNDCGPRHYCEPRNNTCEPQAALGEPCRPGARKGLDGPCFLAECDAGSRRCVAECRRE